MVTGQMFHTTHNAECVFCYLLFVVTILTVYRPVLLNCKLYSNNHYLRINY